MGFLSVPNFQVGFYVAGLTAAFPLFETQFATGNVARVGPDGGTVTLTAVLDAGGFVGGQYIIIVRADDGNLVPETDEGNNTGSTTFDYP